MRRHDLQDATGILFRDPVRGSLIGAGPTVPADGSIGYAPGCLWIDDDAAAGLQLFINEGTKASADFNVVAFGAAGLLATALEINRAADVSTRLVAGGSTLAVTVALHDGKTILLDTAGGSVCTLPVAAATGARIRFAVTVRPSGASHVIKVGNASDFLAGQIHLLDLDSTTATAYDANSTTDDTITINNTTTGGAIGDYIELEDTLANIWTIVHGQLSVPTGSNIASPFSATV